MQKPPGKNEIAVGGQIQPLVLKGTETYMPNSFYTHYVRNNSLVLRVLKVEVPSLRTGNRYIIVPNFEKLRKDGDFSAIHSTSLKEDTKCVCPCGQMGGIMV